MDSGEYRHDPLLSSSSRCTFCRSRSGGGCPSALRFGHGPQNRVAKPGQDRAACMPLRARHLSLHSLRLPPVGKHERCLPRMRGQALEPTHTRSSAFRVLAKVGPDPAGIFRSAPTGARGCSHGWRSPRRPEPVERFGLSSFLPRRGRGIVRRCAMRRSPPRPALPLPLRGRNEKKKILLPRVARRMRPRRSTRGYIPPPRWGEFARAKPCGWPHSGQTLLARPVRS